MHRPCFVSSHEGRWIWLVCAYVFVTVLLIHGIDMKGRVSRLQVPKSILSQVDEDMEDRDPSAIHIMQMILGSKSPRFQMVFLKSLLLHHFEKGEPNPAPIHLHFLTDNATRFIVEGILESWRLNQIRFTFYPAEPIQAKIGWMKSRHSATKVATMKMYLPEILHSTVAKVLLLDSDTVLMTDVVELWRHFDNFNKYQFLGMAIEQATMPFDFTRFGGNKRSFGYNAGIMMWHMQRLTQAKWDAIWQPTLERTMKVYTWLPAAEQTLINAVILDNPDIFYSLPCTWNLQMYEAGHSEDCLSTWNRPPGDGISEPKLLHADRVDKLETKFWLNESQGLAKSVLDITRRYIAIRSQYHMQDGYRFRHQPIEAPVFDFRRVMSRLHPDGQVMSPIKLCLSHWHVFSPWCDNLSQFLFTLDHRLHPLFVSQDYKQLTKNSDDVTLAVPLDINNFKEFRLLATRWSGFISVAVHATDQEAHKLLVQIEKSVELKSRNDIFYHVVYRNSVSARVCQQCLVLAITSFLSVVFRERCPAQYGCGLLTNTSCAANTTPKRGRRGVECCSQGKQSPRTSGRHRNHGEWRQFQLHLHTPRNLRFEGGQHLKSHREPQPKPARRPAPDREFTVTERPEGGRQTNTAVGTHSQRCPSMTPHSGCSLSTACQKRLCILEKRPYFITHLRLEA